jgi:hypothetical protein
VRSTAAPYTESRLTRSVANERVGFPVVEQLYIRVLTIISVCLICIVDTLCVHILVIPLHILKTVSLAISHHTVLDFCSFSPAAAFVGTTVAPRLLICYYRQKYHRILI